MKSNSGWMKASLPQQQEFCLENNQLQWEYPNLCMQVGIDTS